MTRDCDHFRARLDDWLDGTIEDADRSRIEAHLADCQACASMASAERRLTMDLSILNDLGNRIAHQAVEAPPQTKPRTRFNPGRIAAAVAILVGGGYAAVQFATRTPGVKESSDIDVNVESPAPIQTTFMMPRDDTRMSVRMPSENPRVHIVWLYDTAPDVAADAPIENESEGAGSAAPHVEPS
ncbi:MAG: zf-HC2 domain-containing protein [Phycisphaerales bacterium]|nr:zf-HC2 domain-containing protein [Phycisphaerales bacterium]